MGRFLRTGCIVVFVALALPLAAGDRARGGTITSVSISGPGGTGTYTIDNQFVVPTVYYQAAFTSIAPIDFVIGVDSPGLYSISFAVPPGSVLNSTGVDISGLQFSLVSGPAGTFSNQGSYNLNLPLSDPSFPDSTSFRVDGPPNLKPGEWGGIGITYNVGGTGGPQTITVRLTPFSAVPEPSSVILLAFSAAAFLGLGLSRHSRAVQVGEPRMG